MWANGRTILSKTDGISEARQEGSTNGECSTHTPPYPYLPWKMHFLSPTFPCNGC